MHRSNVLKSLQQYKHKYPEESKIVEQFSAFVKNNEDCFERSLHIGHITGSSVLLNPAKDHILLTHHAKLDKWIQLGGHADGNSEALEVALIEAKEESGIEGVSPLLTEVLDIDIHKIPANSKDPEHFHFDLRYLFIANTEDFNISNESIDLKWFTFDEAINIADSKNLVRLFNKAKAFVTDTVR